MEIVKQYLEKRIERLKADLELMPDPRQSVSMHMEAELFLERTFRLSDISELEQVLTLFNEEYEKNNKIISDLHDRIEELCI